MPKKSISVLILHWFPLEQFPPAQNLLNVLGSKEQLEVVCCSTRKPNDYHFFSHDHITIKRSYFPSTGSNIFFRVLRFLSFPWLCLWTAFWTRPSVLIYYEPHSAIAAFVCLLLNPRCRLLIHFHEYREPKHFLDRGNALARLGHWLEKRWLFRKAEWISHTNDDRIRLFLADCPNVALSKMHALPNMPPQKWVLSANEKSNCTGESTKLIYIGAISLHDTYLEPLLDWFSNARNEKTTLDLFINNVDSATRDFLAKQKLDGLTIHLGGVPYEQLPTILPKYNVGLILYRCNSINYVYNAPNKLFEYLICGLNVIYPKQMVGVAPYARSECSPWVKSIDFDKLSELSIDDFRKWNGSLKPWEQTCETVYQQIVDKILVSNSES
jgi:hypothetical protein